MVLLTGGTPHDVRAADPDAALLAQCPAEVALYPWPVLEACAVSWCESRWQVGAVGGDNYGWFQLWGGWALHFGLPSRNALLDGPTNVRLAYAIWLDAGWGPWACKP